MFPAQLRRCCLASYYRLLQHRACRRAVGKARRCRAALRDDNGVSQAQARSFWKRSASHTSSTSLLVSEQYVARADGRAMSARVDIAARHHRDASRSTRTRGSSTSSRPAQGSLRTSRRSRSVRVESASYPRTRSTRTPKRSRSVTWSPTRRSTTTPPSSSRTS